MWRQEGSAKGVAAGTSRPVRWSTEPPAMWSSTISSISSTGPEGAILRPVVAHGLAADRCFSSPVAPSSLLFFFPSPPLAGVSGYEFQRGGGLRGGRSKVREF